MSRVIIIYSVIIFAGVISFFVGSRYAFQKACKRRTSHPVNLETADDEQNSLSTKNEKNNNYGIRWSEISRLFL